MKSFLLFIFFLISVTAICQDEQITFESDGLTLNATLSLPESGNQPYPVAILVHGSGPNDRNQTLTLNDGNSLCLYPGLFNQTIRNFKDIADYLAEKGIAVLRYDKRTFTHRFTLVESEILVSDFVIDIESAIEYVRSISELDGSKIFLMGHSQGSSLIPIAARNAEDIKGLISLAGPTTPIDSLLPEQFRELFTRCANDPVTGANVADQFYEQFQQIRNGTFPLDEQIMLTIPGNPNPIPQGYGSFWDDWIRIGDNVVTNYSEADIMTLVIQGDEDFNVPSSDAEAFSVLDKVELNLYAGINHFLTARTENTVSESILGDIVEWINSCVTSSNDLNQEDQDNFNIYRVHDQLIVETNSLYRECKINILSVDGRLLASQNISDTKTSILLPPCSSYIVQILHGNNSFSKVVR